MILLDGSDDQAPSLQSLLADARVAEPPTVGAPDDTCVIVYTSGTTGLPKGVMHSQRNFVTAGEAFVQRVHLQESDRVMIVLPLFHMNAMFYRLPGTLAGGGSAIIVPQVLRLDILGDGGRAGGDRGQFHRGDRRDPQSPAAQRVSTRHKIRAIYGSARAPPRRSARVQRSRSAQRLRHDRDSRRHLQSVRQAEQAGQHGRDRPDIPIRPGRGRSAASSTTTAMMFGDGEVGELAVKTPIVMQGYFRDPEQTAAAFRDGWFMTGDLVRSATRTASNFMSRARRTSSAVAARTSPAPSSTA